MSSTPPRLAQACRAVRACDAVTEAALGREFAIEALRVAEVTDCQRVPHNAESAREKVGPVLGELAVWLMSALPFARAYFMHTTHERLIVFKGTARLPEPQRHGTLNPRDYEARIGWMFNLSLSSNTKVQAVMRDVGFDYPGLVHAGFLTILSSYDWTAIRRFASTGPGELVLTGHSQGGAVATLAAYRLASEGVPVNAVYTFGSPRPGDIAFRAGYDLPHLRFENLFDPVPMFCPPPGGSQNIPRWLRGMLAGGASATSEPIKFRHVGQLVISHEDGSLESETFAGEAAARTVFFAGATFSRAGRERIAAGHRTARYVADLTSALERQATLPEAPLSVTAAGGSASPPTRST